MRRAAALAVVSVLSMTTMGWADDIRVWSGGAPTAALETLIPQFEKWTGHHIAMTYQVISALKQRLASGGEAPDMVLLPLPAIADLAKIGKLKQQGSLPFGTVKLVAIVRAGATRPDVSTPQAFRDTLLKARSIVYSTPTATPSGAHMARLVTELGIADAIRDKVTYRPALDGGAALVATGEAEIGIYPSSEVLHVKGVVQAGPLPNALQLAITYGGAVSEGNTSPEPALAFIRFLADADNTTAWRDAGFEPP